MKALYNSTTGRVSRPRIRQVGQMPTHLINELKGMDKFELKRMQIAASMKRIKN